MRENEVDLLLSSLGMGDEQGGGDDEDLGGGAGRGGGGMYPFGGFNGGDDIDLGGMGSIPL
jgi:hypothetical protein